MKIMILGCGPAGLMAAHAVIMANGGLEHSIERGVKLRIHSRRQKSSMYGAQYLHQPIPYVTPPTPRRIDYRLVGGIEGYRRKVYGQMWDGTVSPEDLADPHNGWDIRATYDLLWRMYSNLITDNFVDPAWLHYAIDRDEPDLVINTIPLDALCYRGHTFGFTEVIAAGDAPDLGIDVNSMYLTPEETVVCDGTKDRSWYRKSRVFGHTTVEWPASVGRVPIKSAAIVRKPTYHACDCWPDVFKVGRYGSWSKGILSHTAYFNTFDKIKSMTEGKDEAAEATA